MNYTILYPTTGEREIVCGPKSEVALLDMAEANNVKAECYGEDGVLICYTPEPVKS